MTKNRSLIIISTLIFMWVIFCGISSAVALATVGKWDIYEISLTSSQTHVNPFTDVTLIAAFTSPTGKVLTVEGFYDGDGNGGQDGNIWKIRFSPNEEGVWTYTTSSAEDTGLDNKSGSFTCTAPNSRGFLRVDPVFPHHFQYDNNEPFFMRGMWFLNMLSDLYTLTEREGFIQWFAEHNYNRIAIYSAGIQPSYPAKINPWLGEYDFSRYDLAKWHEWDRVIAGMKAAGIISDIWFFSDDAATITGAIGAGSNEERMYFRYIVSRWGAYSNVIWNLGLETEDYRSSQWREDTGNFISGANTPLRSIGVTIKGKGVGKPLRFSDSKKKSSKIPHCGDRAEWNKN